MYISSSLDVATMAGRAGGRGGKIGDCKGEEVDIRGAIYVIADQRNCGVTGSRVDRSRGGV